MNTEQPTWSIAITFCDEENNGFVTLGGAAWNDQDEWNRQWSAIPASPCGSDDPSMLVADKIDESDDRVDERFITADTAEQLLGRPLDELIAEGRAKTPLTLGQLLQQEPELAADFGVARQAN
ncbi:hypothetical protein [Halomonas sp. I5-271120]|uniref:hypothetical protein n=1 Tax=Halomonas sp. I5-271120 TaxID=3061632 RepID=UPI0027144AAE|nr:hypothetical protein [Halomonas sp. I5-271120]